MDVSIQQLYQAYQLCHKGKAKTSKAQLYSAKLLDNLYDMQGALQSQSYQAKPASCFVATNGAKPREIHAADFADRVMHHFLVPKLEAIISHKFIYTSCANQKGKGTHFGVFALQKMMRQVPADSYYLQLDIHNFFYSSDKAILLSILARHIKQAVKKQQISLKAGRDYYRLCRKILKRGKQANTLTPEQLQLIPAHKQLRHVAEGKGLPIGNLSSQFFGNVMMNELDHYIKHTLKAKHYVRFVDDFILLGDKPQLRVWQQDIEHYLKANLALRLKDDIKLMSIQSGADFLGYIIYPHYLLVRKRVLANFYQKLQQWQQQFIHNGKITLSKQAAEQLQSCVASYLGHLKHAKSYKAIQKLGLSFPWLNTLFFWEGKPNKSQYKMKRQAQEATYLNEQWLYFKRHFVGYIIVLQKGSCWLLEAQYGQYLPVQVQQYCVQKQSSSVAPKNTQLEIPLYFLKNSLNCLQRQQLAYILVTEQGVVHKRLKQRMLRIVYAPLKTASRANKANSGYQFKAG